MESETVTFVFSVAFVYVVKNLLYFPGDIFCLVSLLVDISSVSLLSVYTLICFVSCFSMSTFVSLCMSPLSQTGSFSYSVDFVRSTICFRLFSRCDILFCVFVNTWLLDPLLMIACTRPQLSVRSLGCWQCCVGESTVAPAKTHSQVLDCGLLNSSTRPELTLIVVVLSPWTSTLVLLHFTPLAQVYSSSFLVAVRFCTRLLFFFLLPFLGQIMCVYF